jgi:hypothetical protein
LRLPLFVLVRWRKRREWNRVEAIPMFLLTVPIQICQVKLVICLTERSSISTHWISECVHKCIPITEPLSVWQRW